MREALKGSLDKEKRGPANYILGYILFENGNTQGARGFLTEASRFPMKRAYSVQSHYLLGLALARLGDCNGAKAEFIAAETEGDGSEVPKKNVYQMLSNVSQSLGEANEARRYEGLAKGVRQ